MKPRAIVRAIEPIYLTPREAADVLLRSLDALYRLIEADPSFPRVRLPSKGKSGGLLIPRAGLERWLADHSEGTKSPVRLAVSARPSAPPQRTDAPGALNGAANG